MPVFFSRHPQTQIVWELRLKKTFYRIFASLALLVSLASCDNWFDVTPSTQNPEDDQFSTEAGFKHQLDYGVPYHYDLSFVGEQYEFKQGVPYRNDNYPGSGASARDTATVIQGNTFDYPYIHGKALRDNRYSFSSCSKNAIENLNNYDVVDLILGKQCDTPLFELYPTHLQQVLFEYVQQKKHRLIITGAYVASSEKSDAFLQSAFKSFEEDCCHQRTQSLCSGPEPIDIH